MGQMTLVNVLCNIMNEQVSVTTTCVYALTKSASLSLTAGQIQWCVVALVLTSHVFRFLTTHPVLCHHWFSMVRL